MGYRSNVAIQLCDSVLKTLPELLQNDLKTWERVSHVHNVWEIEQIKWDPNGEIEKEWIAFIEKTGDIAKAANEPIYCSFMRIGDDLNDNERFGESFSREIGFDKNLECECEGTSKTNEKKLMALEGRHETERIPEYFGVESHTFQGVKFNLLQVLQVFALRNKLELVDGPLDLEENKEAISVWNMFLVYIRRCITSSGLYAYVVMNRDLVITEKKVQQRNHLLETLEFKEFSPYKITESFISLESSKEVLPGILKFCRENTLFESGGEHGSFRYNSCGCVCAFALNEGQTNFTTFEDPESKDNILGDFKNKVFSTSTWTEEVFMSN